jgi:hypothetical protein
MYLEELPGLLLTTTLVKIKYDCCGKEHTLKWKDADKNFCKNNQKHICRPCWLKMDNPAKRLEVKEKTKKTNLEKYGSTCSMNSEENVKKRTKIMFGTEESKNRILEKRRQTSLKKYGTEHPMESEEVKKNLKKSLMEKYGVDNPLKSEEIRQKVSQTNLEKYGNKCSLHGIEIKQKTIETMMEKYGVEHYNQLPEMKDYLRENCKEWLKESWESGGPNKGIKRPKEWNDKQSKTVVGKMMRGEWYGNTKTSISGWHRSEKCPKKKCFIRSSYELKVCFLLDKDDRVLFYDTEPFVIEYEFEDSIHRYLPDFLIKYKNRENLLVVEVKPEDQKRWDRNIAKEKSAIAFCENKKLDFEIWDEKDIKIINKNQWNKMIKNFK